jgi:hypothetical protein
LLSCNQKQQVKIAWENEQLDEDEIAISISQLLAKLESFWQQN